ncbi:MAG: hypothetical protein ACXWPS_14325 [Ktedonobacteraceae bacterium]
MQRQRIDTTGAIMMQTGEFQQVFEMGLNGGLCGGGCRFKLELPVTCAKSRKSNGKARNCCDATPDR